MSLRAEIKSVNIFMRIKTNHPCLGKIIFFGLLFSCMIKEVANHGLIKHDAVECLCSAS